MLKKFSDALYKTANVIVQSACPALDSHDRSVLLKDGPALFRQVQTNIKMSKKPLDDLSDTNKKVLLAYIVFFRQNITTLPKLESSNEEDAAKILHGEVYENSKDKKKLQEDLLDQLSKVGLNIDD